MQKISVDNAGLVDRVSALQVELGDLCVTALAEITRLKLAVKAARAFHNAWSKPLPASRAVMKARAADLLAALDAITPKETG